MQYVRIPPEPSARLLSVSLIMRTMSVGSDSVCLANRSID